MGDLMVLKMHSTTQVDGAATLDCPFDGMIAAVAMNVHVTGADVLNDAIRAELSFGSVSGFSINDTRSSFFGCSSSMGAVTTGGGNVAQTATMAFGQDGIPIAAGERLYLHVTPGGTVTSAVTVWIYIRVTGLARADRRRI